MNVLLSLDSVSVKASPGQRWILDSISLQIESGEFVGLLGPSGAGKSSLLKLMNRLSEPSVGEIHFQGIPVEKMSPIDLRRQVMLVGQECRLLGMTVQDAIRYPLLLQGMSLTRSTARLEEWLERLKLPREWLDRTEVQLSGGQQQQVAIARALVMEPTLLLLDEPTAGQDLGTATRILSVIQTQVKDAGLAVIMSNHQLELAEQFCDRVLYLDQGCLVWDKSAREVDWQALRQALIDADARNQEEWGEVF